MCVWGIRCFRYTKGMRSKNVCCGFGCSIHSNAYSIDQLGRWWTHQLFQISFWAMNCSRCFSCVFFFWHHASFFWFSSLDQSSCYTHTKSEWEKRFLFLFDQNVCWNRAIRIELLFNLLPQRTNERTIDRTRKKGAHKRGSILHSDGNLFLTVMQPNAGNGQGATRRRTNTFSFQFRIYRKKKRNNHLIHLWCDRY